MTDRDCLARKGEKIARKIIKERIIKKRGAIRILRRMVKTTDCSNHFIPERWDPFFLICAYSSQEINAL